MSAKTAANRRFPDLREVQAHQLLADDEVVGACDRREVAVAHIAHLADDREGPLRHACGDVAQVKERHHRARARW